MRAIYIDTRWMGEHGIGRFTKEAYEKIPNLKLANLSLSPSHPLDALVTTAWILSNRNALLFSPGFNSPILGLKRYIITVHDLNHIDLDANSSLLKRMYYKYVLRNACRNAAKVLTVSEFSRQRIIDWSGVSGNQVINVGNGISSNFHENVFPHQPGYPYLFCVSNRKKHKNEERLIKAFASANIEKTISLIISGSPSQELKELISQLELNNRVIFSGRLTEDALAKHYKGAIALLFPSLYEGFGLPVIESMACGTPVVTSNTTSLPEVAGEAALLIDPTNISEIATSIEKICSDEDLRKKLVSLGFIQARKFSWEITAGKIDAVIQSASNCFPPVK